MRLPRLPYWVSLSLLCWLGACAGKSETPSGSGGATDSGGTDRSGGTSGSGGTYMSGGRSSSGGVVGSGGSLAAGGTSGVGGSARVGGSSASGGSPGSTGGSGRGRTGGGSPSGGRSAIGGGSGGRSSPGGGTGAGAATSSGGASGPGGATAAGGRTGTGGGTGTGGATHTGKWQIMPLGDSITGTTCYPKLLAQKLTDNGHTNFTFVGSVLNNQSCGSAPNVQTEGHGGYLVTYLTTDSPPQGGKGKLSELKTWAAEQPEVVLLEYGTNDVWSSIATSSIISAFGFVVDQFRSQNPDVIFFVAQITPLNPSGCASCETNVEALNAAIPAWAASKSTAASPVYVVDIWSSLPAAGYTPNSTYTSDGCHPNQAGSQRMADQWYEGLLAKGIP